MTLSGRSGKGSCSASPEDDMDDTHPCQLYIWDGTKKTLVDHGKYLRQPQLFMAWSYILWPKYSNVSSPSQEIWLILTPGTDSQNHHILNF